MNNNRGSENRRYLHGTRARQADRESFIALLINQCYNSLVTAMDIHDEVTAQYILRMSEDELRAVCLVSDRFPHSGGGGLWYPENLRFARALRSIEHLALFMDVHAIVERWDWQPGEFATWQAYPITEHQITYSGASPDNPRSSPY